MRHNVRRMLYSVCAVMIAALFINGTYFVFFYQKKSWEKLQHDQELSAYEVFSAYTMHTACWLFGWAVEPSTAEICFCKQFHLPYPHFARFPKDDEHLAEVREELKPGQSRYLAWKLERGKYISRASILLNGATMTCISKEDGVSVYRYDNPVDYGKCYVTIAGVPFCEGLFDYLENKGILSLDRDVRYVEYTVGKKRGRTLSRGESRASAELCQGC